MFAPSVQLARRGAARAAAGARSAEGGMQWDAGAAARLAGLAGVAGLGGGALGIAAGLLLGPALLAEGLAPLPTVATTGMLVLLVSPRTGPARGPRGPSGHGCGRFQGRRRCSFCSRAPRRPTTPRRSRPCASSAAPLATSRSPRPSPRPAALGWNQPARASTRPGERRSAPPADSRKASPARAHRPLPLPARAPGRGGAGRGHPRVRPRHRLLPRGRRGLGPQPSAPEPEPEPEPSPLHALDRGSWPGAAAERAARRR
jgi:hypothetical protein